MPGSYCRVQTKRQFALCHASNTLRYLSEPQRAAPAAETIAIRGQRIRARESGPEDQGQRIRGQRIRLRGSQSAAQVLSAELWAKTDIRGVGLPGPPVRCVR